MAHARAKLIYYQLAMVPDVHHYSYAPSTSLKSQVYNQNHKPALYSLLTIPLFDQLYLQDTQPLLIYLVVSDETHA